MATFILEVDGVWYKCWDGMDRAEVVGTDEYYFTEKMMRLTLRRFLEVNGKRYVLTNVTAFGGERLIRLATPVSCCYSFCRHKSVEDDFQPVRFRGRNKSGFNFLSRRMEIRIPSSVEYIRECYLFRNLVGCDVIFELDSKLKEIGDYAFCESCIQVIRIPSNVEKIGTNCFC
jgi:hypothetical protein